MLSHMQHAYKSIQSAVHIPVHTQHTLETFNSHTVTHVHTLYHQKMERHIYHILFSLTRQDRQAGGIDNKELINSREIKILKVEQETGNTSQSKRHLLPAIRKHAKHTCKSMSPVRCILCFCLYRSFTIVHLHFTTRVDFYHQHIG